MERRKFIREFKLEAVKLVRERCVTMAQTARDLGVHGNVVRRWVREYAADTQPEFPGQGQMKPDQLELERLRREAIPLKAERDIPKKRRGLLREGGAVQCGFIVKHRGSWPTAWLCEALGVSRGWVLCVAGAADARAATRCGAPRSRRVFRRATGPKADGACGTTCWLREKRAACIESSDSCGNRPYGPGPDDAE